MIITQGSARAAALVICLALALGAVAGCGGGNDTSTSSEASTTAAGGGGGGGSGGGGGADAANPLANISPPPGSKKLDSRSGNGVEYEHYSSSESPSQVQASYKQELTSDHWSIVNTGGSGGGWGPYGGSNYGLTAKRENDYIDVQAGGQKGAKSYFEVCATTGGGTREACNNVSNQSNQHTNSGGSQGGSNSNKTHSGGS